MKKPETEFARFAAPGPIAVSWPVSSRTASSAVENSAKPSSKPAAKENILQKVPPQVQQGVKRLQRTQAYQSLERSLRDVWRRTQQTKTYQKLEDTYAWKFFENLKKDNHFWTWLGGIQAGSSHLWRAGIFIAALLSAPVIGQVFGITACAALIAVGLVGICYGLPKAWKSMEEHCAETFPTFNPARKARVRARHHAKKIAENSSVQKLQSNIAQQAGKVAQHPRIKKVVEALRVQEFLDSRFVNACRNPTPRQQHMFLSAMTIEQALTSTALYAVVAAAFIGAASTGGLAVIAALMAYEVGTSAFSLYNGIKTLKQLSREGKDEKEPVAGPSPAATPSLKIKALPVPADRASAFNGRASRTPYRKPASAQIPAPLPPARYRLPSTRH
jgi:hypothetical protein